MVNPGLSNQVLQNRIGYLLKRPVERPANHARVTCLWRPQAPMATARPCRGSSLSASSPPEGRSSVGYRLGRAS
jgi:hypothetical protein